jgi:hypothetical protein
MNTEHREHLHQLIEERNTLVRQRLELLARIEEIDAELDIA